MEPVLENLGRLGLMPIIKIDRAEDAAPLGRALLAGGLPCAEVTFRTAAAEEAIRNLGRALPELLLGAGTVVTTGQAERAVRAGARFIVSPGYSPAVVDWCLAHEITPIPGVATPTDVMQAMEKGLSVLKFFPAEAFGGIATLTALAGPFSGIQFLPTGGVNAGNLAAYLRLPSVLACGGTWIAENRLISRGHFPEITRLADEACAIVKAVRQGQI
jgi:2-dehydro-3-deoxyphosphogluconate aldolase / (4S)-4-hydroxy-2-oxoglutarate aldolase